MKIHILSRNALNCALYLEFNVFFTSLYFMHEIEKNTTLVFSFIFLEFVLLVHDTSHNTLSFSALKKEKNDFYILGLTPLKNN